MNEGFREYLIKKLDAAINDYTTMRREDLCDYILFYVKWLLEYKEIE